jgi:hypothetical protein
VAPLFDALIGEEFRFVIVLIAATATSSNA